MSHLPPFAHHAREGTAVGAMFDGIAPRYDLLNTVLSLGFDRSWRRRAVRAALTLRPRRVLDVATGTAELAIAIKRSRPEVEVRGIDLSERMLEVGRAKAARAGLDVPLERGDGTDLPFPDASFDAVTIGYGLRNFADLEAGLREFRRILAPCGRLVVLEFPPPPAGAFGRLFRAYFTRVLPRIGGFVSGDAGAYAYLPASVLAFPEPEELARRMEAAGFQAVTWTAQTWGISALHVGHVPAVGCRGGGPAQREATR